MNSQEQKLLQWCEAHNLDFKAHKKRNNHYNKKYQKKDKIKNKKGN